MKVLSEETLRQRWHVLHCAFSDMFSAGEEGFMIIYNLLFEEKRERERVKAQE